MSNCESKQGAAANHSARVLFGDGSQQLPLLTRASQPTRHKNKHGSIRTWRGRAVATRGRSAITAEPRQPCEGGFWRLTRVCISRPSTFSHTLMLSLKYAEAVQART